MKAKKIIALAIGGLTYIMTVMIVVGYGNKQNHPDLNTYIIDDFKKNYNLQAFAEKKFENFIFFFDYYLEADGITKEGLFHPEQVVNVGVPVSYYEEGKLDLRVADWIAHGGMSADVPEVPASLRHFYDPTKPEGERYLNDKVNAKLMAFLQSLMTNPRIDDVEWAIGKVGAMGAQEHNYSWENGKNWMKMALETSNETKQKEYLAKAMRSLGESLHMIADHGCPSHVRNDAHPSPLWDYNNIFGNPDPYEEYMAIIGKKEHDLFASFANGAQDASLKAQFKNAKTLRQIAHDFAVYTNKNFYTTETISGTDWKGNTVKPISNPNNPYPSPKLDNMNYTNNYYVSTINGVEVKQCTDLSYFAKLIPHRTYPFVDKECVISQAKVLIPQIISAGSHTIKLFIPNLKVEITQATTSTVSGTIKHTLDDEYKNEIKYSGKIVINRYDKDGTFKEKINGIASNGKFDIAISGQQGDKLTAWLETQAFAVKSNSFDIESEELYFTQAKIYVEFEIAYYNYNGSTYYNDELCSYASYNDAASAYFPGDQGNIYEGSFNGSKFDGEASYGTKKYGSASFSINGKTNMVLSHASASYDNGTSDMNNFNVIQSSITLANIPMKEFKNGYILEFEATGNEAKSLIQSINYKIQCKTNLNKIYTLDFTKSKIKKILVRFTYV